MDQKKAQSGMSLRRAITIMKTIFDSLSDFIKLTAFAAKKNLHVVTLNPLLRKRTEERQLIFAHAAKTYKLEAKADRIGWCSEKKTGLETTSNLVLEKFLGKAKYAVISSINSVCLRRKDGAHPVRILVLNVDRIYPLSMTELWVDCDVLVFPTRQSLPYREAVVSVQASRLSDLVLPRRELSVRCGTLE